MPNIFGKDWSDYTHLRDIESDRKPRGLTEYLQKKNMNFSDFELNKGVKTLRGMQDSVDPAAGVTWLRSNLSAMQPEVDEILYSNFRLQELLPIKTDIPEGAKSYFYQVVDHKGRGTFIDNRGIMAPTATASAKTVTYDIRLGGIVAKWSNEDLRAALFGGVNLEAETIQAATEGSLDHIEAVGIGTSPEEWFEGITNLSKVPVITAATPWSSLSGDDLIKAITSPITSLIENTHEIFGRVIKSDLALYIPISLMDQLQSYRASVSDRTIMELTQKNNAWTHYTGRPLQFKQVQELDTAGGGNTRRVLYGFPTEPRVWEFSMPISPRAGVVIQEHFGVSLSFEYKISGVNAKRPEAMLYVDNV